MSGANVFNSIPVLDPFNPPFGPTPDNDFFSADVEEEGYNKARRLRHCSHHCSYLYLQKLEFPVVENILSDTL